MAAALPLDSREGLPDALAYLRASYPKPRWQTHLNFGELTRFWLGVHDSLRHEGTTLIRIVDDFRARDGDTLTFQRRFVPQVNRFLQHLTMHHRIEDSAYFPKFRALDPRMVAGFDLLEADHEVIHEALVASSRSGQALIDAIVAPRDWRPAVDAYVADAERLLLLLRRHLADEEDLVVPAMLHHGERAVG